MTGILFDLNTLTKHVDDLTQEAGQTKKQYVQDVYTSRDPYYVKKILELSEKVNLIESNDENISLKEDGKNLLEKFETLHKKYLLVGSVHKQILHLHQVDQLLI